MRKIRKGDQVVVLSGRDKGRRGAVLEVLGDRAAARREHQRREEAPARQSAGGQPGGIVDKTMPIRASKVAIWNPSGKKGDRVGVKKLADGRKVRFFKSNGEMIDA